jgi:hypothetical protein
MMMVMMMMMMMMIIIIIIIIIIITTRDSAYSFNKALDNSKHSKRDKMLLIKLI